MEVEAKFRVEDENAFARLLAVRSWGPYALEAEPEAELQQNTYFDTEDGRVRTSGSVLRVRTVGSARIATFKGPTRLVGPTHEREEWEVLIGDDRPSPLFWPPGEARDRALALVDEAPLHPIVEVRTKRHDILVALGGLLLAHVSLDEGTISAGGRTISFREVEIESDVACDRVAFDTFVRDFEARWHFAREPRSKFARGLELIGAEQ